MFGNVKRSEFNFAIRDIAREINKVEKRLHEIELHFQKCENCNQCKKATKKETDE